jgi:hypothetical protein
MPQLLGWIVKVGLTLSLITFGIYLTGHLAPRPEAARVPHYWELSAGEFAAATESARGWDWATDLANASVLAFAALVVFPVGSILTMIAAAILFFRDRDYVYVLFCIAEATVLSLAAAGLFANR